MPHTNNILLSSIIPSELEHTNTPSPKYENQCHQLRLIARFANRSLNLRQKFLKSCTVSNPARQSNWRTPSYEGENHCSLYTATQIQFSFLRCWSGGHVTWEGHVTSSTSCMYTGSLITRANYLWESERPMYIVIVCLHQKYICIRSNLYICWHFHIHLY